jgi:CO dehydrogenase/acetyl-CoA synthase epsilon subunit
MTDIAARMIAETNRRHSVALTALRMLQSYHDNRYFSFSCVSKAEEKRWYALAERFVAPVETQG